MSTQYRRVRKSDRDLLVEICECDSRWPKYFVEHTTWVERALLDVWNDSRVVFGAFQHSPIEQNVGRYQLIGCLFLGMAPYEFERTIEFKNLILPTGEIHLSDSNKEVATHLIDKATRFCEVRGIQRIEIEIPQQEYGILSLFLERQFRVVSFRERYKPGLRVCVLERRVGDTYNGDPFDKTKLANWLLRDFVNCDISPPEEIGANFTKFSFVIQNAGPAFSADTKTTRSKRLQGALWVLERPSLSVDTIVKTICTRDTEPFIKLLLVDNIGLDAKTRLAQSGITVFDDSETREIAGGSKSSLSIPIDEEDVGGMLTVLDREEFLRYIGKPTLTYYLLSGIHAGLQLPEGKDVILAIYCPNWKNQRKGIVGYYRIDMIQIVPFYSFDSLGEDLTLPADSALSVEDLKHYKTFSDQEEIAILKCVDFRLAPSPIPIADGKWVSSDSIERYLLAEIEDTASNAAYLDWESCKNLNELITRSDRKQRYKKTAPNAATSIEPPKPQFDVFIAYNSIDKSVVEQVAKSLQLRGLSCWIDSKNIPPGTWSQKVIQKALANVRAVAVFIGRKGLGRYQKIELLAALSRCVEREIPVIPILLPGLSNVPEDSDLDFLRQLQCVRFLKITDERAIEELVRGIKNDSTI